MSNSKRRNVGTGREILSKSAFGRLLMQRAGMARGLGAEIDYVASERFEQLENRFLLAGDHPSFPDTFDPDNLPDATEVVLDGAGEGAVGGLIDPALDNDLFFFVASADDFVTVRADTINVTGGSDLNSRVEVYDTQGNMITSGSGGDSLSGGVQTDGWAGFVAQAGEGYFVRVLSDLPSGTGATGGYSVRVDAATDLVMLNGAGEASASGTVGLAGQDVVYRVTTGDTAAFDSLATLTGQAGSGVFDLRLDLYDGEGQFVSGDSQSGRLTNPFMAWRSGQDETFYVRVRGDEFGPGDALSTGAFTFALDASATGVAIDPVTRQGTATAASVGNNSTSLASFVAQGTGLTIIPGTATGAAAVDLALQLYDDSGEFIGFSDNVAGTSPQMEIQLTGGSRYFLVMDGFNSAAEGAVTSWIESHHTFNTNTPIDDHIDAPDVENDPADVVASSFARATPIIWGNAISASDGVTGDPLNDHSLISVSIARGRLHTGTDSDVFMITPPVNMLGSFQGKDDGGDPAVWQQDHRPASRLHIVAFQVNEPFLNAAITVYDSNYDVVYDTNSEIFNPGWNFTGDPAGMADPASYPPDLNLVDHGFEFVGDPIGISVWGGETYFIEITAESGSAESYNIITFVDAMPGEDGTGEHIDSSMGNLVSRIREDADAGEWAAARQIILDSNTGDGDATGPSDNGFNSTAANERCYSINGANCTSSNWLADPVGVANGGIAMLQETGLPVIESVTDTDLFFFRAPADGTAEIRTFTTSIASAMSELIIDGEDDPANPTITQNLHTKTISSYLDSAIRIFNNDFEQIAYNDDNPAIMGQAESQRFGELSTFEFTRRDARVVFDMVAGETYFIQVESAQAAAWMAAQSDPSVPIDWRSATGVYDVLIHTVPNLNFDDDHADLVDGPETAIPINTDIGDPANGSGSVTGVIDNTFSNPEDIDGFGFFAPAKGPISLQASALDGSMVIPRITIIDAASGEIIVRDTAGSNGIVEVNITALQGERFYVIVDGPNGNEGEYRLDVQATPFEDDHQGALDLANATPLEILDFLGMTETTGRLESGADFDAFSFQAEAFDLVTLSVEADTPTFDPFVEVYEITEDGTINPYATRIFFDDNSGSGNNAAGQFSITPNRTSLTTGNTYNTYYVVVSTADGLIGEGDYNLRLDLTPTDDHPDVGQFDLATFVNINAAAGSGEATGVLEKLTDSDLFGFTVPAGGFARVGATSDDGSFDPTLTIFDANLDPIHGPITGSAGGTLVDFFEVARSQRLYVLVEGGTGAYTLDLLTPTVDDHANITEFDRATPIQIALETGTGFDSGDIRTEFDTDMFRFEPVADGDVTISVLAPSGDILPRIRVYDQDGVQAFDITGDSPDTGVELTLPGAIEGQRFYVLVNAEAGGDLIGTYTVAISGQASEDKPFDDDHANAGQFDFATAVNLSTRTGDGQIQASVDTAGDSDLFRLTSLAGGQAFVQVVTSDGSLLNGAIRVFNGAHSQIAFNSVGIAGATADTKFVIGGAGEEFYVLVEGTGSHSGAYTLRIDTEPQTHFLYFPEGFANSSISEFVSLANPNDYAVDYRVVLYYETGSLEAEIANGTIAPESRGGVTISDGLDGMLSGVRPDSPYSVVVESDGPLGATLAHYDFGTAIGESFTGVTSTEWSFAQVQRDHLAVRDFVVFFNPNPNEIVVTLTAYGADAEPVVLTTTVGAFRRGGWNLDQELDLPSGTFAVTVESRASNASDPHIGIVASLSHYDLANDEGYAVLGSADGGATEGVITSITHGDSIGVVLSIFNPTDAPVSVDLFGSYIRAPLPDVTRNVLVPANGVVRLTGQDLRVVADQPIGFRYESSAPISVLAGQSQLDDANAVAASTVAARTWFFGDGFINADLAGVDYFETLTFHNPTESATTVQIKLLFNDGVFTTVDLTVGSDGFASLDLHELPLILSRGGLNFFSVEVSSQAPIVASMTHYDLFLGGGWETAGSALGFTNTIEQIRSGR